MAEKFEARYQVQDGYAGAPRPKHFNISAEDLEDDMTTEEQSVEFYESTVKAHYKAFERDLTLLRSIT